MTNENIYSKPHTYIVPDYKLPKYMPDEFRDQDEALIFSESVESYLKYTEECGFLHFNGANWEQNDCKVTTLIMEFLDTQLAEERNCKKEMENALRMAELNPHGDLLAAVKYSDKKRKQLIYDYLRLKDYEKYLLQMRMARGIEAIRKLAKDLLVTEYNDFDALPNSFNCMDGTYDLETGNRYPHTAFDLITKCAKTAPDIDGMLAWMDFLNQIFLNDKELIAYVQIILGSAIIGKVHEEALYVAYGDGANGKSTFFNTIVKVLGNYAGRISPETLTDLKRNVKPELAELKGKRLIVASELDAGMRLSSGVMKQLCSTDDIIAERKYHPPFTFTPTHTIFLMTNHLPRVCCLDNGTWRRLFIIPFKARFEGSEERKDYGTYLVNNSAPAILHWLMAGAKKFIELKYKIPVPQCVKEAVSIYRAENDWLQDFIEDACIVDKSLEEKASDLYRNYKEWAKANGRRTRSSKTFGTTLTHKGYEKRKTNGNLIFSGLKLKFNIPEN